jgi:hypothetical protein
MTKTKANDLEITWLRPDPLLAYMLCLELISRSTLCIDERSNPLTLPLYNTSKCEVV